MVCETISNDRNEKPKKFKLVTERDHVSVRMKIANMKHNINATILHFGVSSNKTTCDALDSMVIRYYYIIYYKL